MQLPYHLKYVKSFCLICIALFGWRADSQTHIRVFYTTSNEARADLAAQGIDEGDLVTAANSRLDVAFRQNTQVNVVFDVAGYFRWNRVQQGYCLDFDPLAADPDVTARAQESAADLVTVMTRPIGDVAGCTRNLNITSQVWWTQPWFNNDGRAWPHEVGHNFSLGHTGWCDNINHFRTLMLYASQCNEPSIEYFSAAPASGVRWNGFVVGDATHDERTAIINNLAVVEANRVPLNNVALANRILADNEILDVLANTQITTGPNVTAVSGSRLQLRCVGAVTIGDGFTAQAGSALLVRSGPGALAKKSVQIHNHPETVAPLAAIKTALLGITRLPGNMARVTFNLSKSGPISYRIHDLAGKKIDSGSLGQLARGQHVFTCKKLPKAVCVLHLNAGGEIVRSLIMAQ